MKLRTSQTIGYRSNDSKFSAAWVCCSSVGFDVIELVIRKGSNPSNEVELFDNND